MMVATTAVCTIRGIVPLGLKPWRWAVSFLAFVGVEVIALSDTDYHLNVSNVWQWATMYAEQTSWEWCLRVWLPSSP